MQKPMMRKALEMSNKYGGNAGCQRLSIEFSFAALQATKKSYETIGLGAQKGAVIWIEAVLIEDETAKKDREIADLKTSNTQLKTTFTDLKTSNTQLLHIAKASTLTISRSMDLRRGCYAFNIAVFPDDSFAVACEDGYVRVYSSTGDLQYSMVAHEGETHAVAVLPGDRLATGGTNFKVKIWTQDSPHRSHQHRVLSGGVG